MLLVLLFCFFFKQKTAYEMRISDWSSDVCSSDRAAGHLPADAPVHPGGDVLRLDLRASGLGVERGVRRDDRPVASLDHQVLRPDRPVPGVAGRPQHAATADRSEEQTSELQSLMRISYAVFCLQKKKKKQ